MGCLVARFAYRTLRCRDKSFFKITSSPSSFRTGNQVISSLQYSVLSNHRQQCTWCKTNPPCRSVPIHATLNNSRIRFLAVGSLTSPGRHKMPYVCAGKETLADQKKKKKKKGGSACHARLLQTSKGLHRPTSFNSPEVLVSSRFIMYSSPYIFFPWPERS